ncbi:unnamed protein product [Polarella glacialis]|uniref:Hexosyltransferase n=1 Tax=Polarella glacialis TaxID=89957 RepID=A0A813FTT0_POLGL|nr:unnamed protein product [Polarella glacialis]
MCQRNGKIMGLWVVAAAILSLTASLGILTQQQHPHEDIAKDQVTELTIQQTGSESDELVEEQCGQASSPAIQASDAGLKPTLVMVMSVKDRFGYLTLSSSLLNKSVGFNEPELGCLVIDDGSTMIRDEALTSLFPKCSLMRNKASLGPQHSLDCGMLWFLRNIYDGPGSSTFVIMDSDLAVTRNWLIDLRAQMNKTAGVLSLYNSRQHPVRGNLNSELVHKTNAGWAGMAMRGDIVERWLNYTKYHKQSLKFIAIAGDVHFSEWFAPIFAFEKSRAIHYGNSGANVKCALVDAATGKMAGQFCDELPDEAVLSRYKDDFEMELNAIRQYAYGFSSPEAVIYDDKVAEGPANKTVYYMSTWIEQTIKQLYFRKMIKGQQQ